MCKQRCPHKLLYVIWTIHLYNKYIYSRCNYKCTVVLKMPLKYTKNGILPKANKEASMYLQTCEDNLTVCLHGK